MNVLRGYPDDNPLEAFLRSLGRSTSSQSVEEAQKDRGPGGAYRGGHLDTMTGLPLDLDLTSGLSATFPNYRHPGTEEVEPPNVNVEGTGDPRALKFGSATGDEFQVPPNVNIGMNRAPKPALGIQREPLEDQGGDPYGGMSMEELIAIQLAGEEEPGRPGTGLEEVTTPPAPTAPPPPAAAAAAATPDTRPVPVPPAAAAPATQDQPRSTLSGTTGSGAPGAPPTASVLRRAEFDRPVGDQAKLEQFANIAGVVVDDVVDWFGGNINDAVNFVDRFITRPGAEQEGRVAARNKDVRAWMEKYSGNVGTELYDFLEERGGVGGLVDKGIDLAGEGFDKLKEMFSIRGGAPDTSQAIPPKTARDRSALLQQFKEDRSGSVDAFQAANRPADDLSAEAGLGETPASNEPALQKVIQGRLDAAIPSERGRGQTPVRRRAPPPPPPGPHRPDESLPLLGDVVSEKQQLDLREGADNRVNMNIDRPPGVSADDEYNAGQRAIETSRLVVQPLIDAMRRAENQYSIRPGETQTTQDDVMRFREEAIQMLVEAGVDETTIEEIMNDANLLTPSQVLEGYLGQPDLRENE